MFTERLTFYLSTVLLLCSGFVLNAQAPKALDAVDIYNKLEKLKVCGSALYIAAHPDDENTRLISYLSNEEKVRTAYLSLTRGDGGQNLIGKEIKEMLGVLRTQELLQARSVDGGEQFFSRAIDFGYSKHPDETLDIWNKEEVMHDVIKVIREFKPDVIVNRFDHRSPGKTHGHHTSSAMLSFEAFDLSNDPNIYPEQLKMMEPWQAQRLFFNTSWWFYGSRDKFAEADKTNLLSVDIGVYYNNRGKSNSEIASEARSMHKCQGFGSAGTRGSKQEFLELLKGDMPPSKSNIFEGIDVSWGRMKGGAPIGHKIDKVIQDFSYQDPSLSIPSLLNIYTDIQSLSNEHWKKIKTAEIKTIIEACAGLYVEAISDKHQVTQGDSVEIKIEMINRSNISMELNKITLNPIGESIDGPGKLDQNQSNKLFHKIDINSKLDKTYPYWLNEEGSFGMFKVDDFNLIGKPETPRAISLVFDLFINGVNIPIEKNIVYAYTEPSFGPIYRPFEIVDEVFVSIEEEVIVFSDDSEQTITVDVIAKKPVRGKLQLDVPKGWTYEPTELNLDIEKADRTSSYSFQVKPPSTKSVGNIKPKAIINGEEFSSSLTEIEYDHVPFQTVALPEKTKVVRIPIKTNGESIAYIMGAGDKVPDCLEYIGYKVDVFEPNEIDVNTLSTYDAIVLGIRVYNAKKEIAKYQDDLFAYAENGGTLITQYNTTWNLGVDELAPLDLKVSRKRVSNEYAEVRIVNPNHPVLQNPNKINLEDFDDWVQERGLYFPEEWDSNFETILSMNDIGEDPLEGSLLVAKYGKGHFVYTGLSFFRELPAGVPGAYRLFANLISLGSE